jgi:hypothetical protein
MTPMTVDQFTSDFFLSPEAFSLQATHEAFEKDPNRIVDVSIFLLSDSWLVFESASDARLAALELDPSIC